MGVVVKVGKNKHKKNNNAGQIYITKDNLVKGKSRNRPFHLVSQLSIQPPFHHSLPLHRLTWPTNSF